MPDIYEILSKHFLKETTGEEEKQVAEFKKDNPEEYRILQRFWNKRIVKIKDFDAEKAWDIIRQKTTGNRKPFVTIYGRLQRIAAAAAILIMVSIAGYYGYQYYRHAEITVIQTASGHTAKPEILADGTKVWLNKNATLTYPKNFGTTERTVKLSGEAFFEVTHNTKKPFTVKLDNCRVTVLGTSFNIFSDRDSTLVTVTTGKVRVANADNNDVVFVTPGYVAEVSGNKVEKHRSDNPNFLSWKTGEFIFRDIGLKEAVKQLNTYYDNKIKIIDGENDCLLTAHFVNEKPEDVVSVIELTCDVKLVFTPEKK